MNIRLAALTETLFQEEKQFLLGCYTNNFLDLLENQDEGIESEAIEVLLTVRPHVSPDLVERINTLLSINSTQNPELTNIEEASLSSTAAESTEQDAIENVFDKRSAEEEEGEEDEEDEGIFDGNISDNEEEEGIFDGNVSVNEEEEEGIFDGNVSHNEEEDLTNLFEAAENTIKESGTFEAAENAIEESGTFEAAENIIEESGTFEATQGHTKKGSKKSQSFKADEIIQESQIRETSQFTEAEILNKSKIGQRPENTSHTPPIVKDFSAHREEIAQGQEDSTKNYQERTEKRQNRQSLYAAERKNKQQDREIQQVDTTDKKEDGPEISQNEKIDSTENDSPIDLSLLRHVVSIEELESVLGIKVLPDDRLKLDRKWLLKLNETSIQQLINNVTTMKQPYFLIPRLSRFIKDGTLISINLVTMLRTYPQLFENAAQIIDYRTEDFFSKETPEIDWAIVSCEILPTSSDQNFVSQRPLIKAYAQKFQAVERRVKRRNLIEALYDIIILNMVKKTSILSNSVELTNSRAGRQNQVCINFGENGIRINDVSRSQKHPQMGICPNW